MALANRWAAVVGIAAVLAAGAACRGGAKNPLLGSWELDADQTGVGVAAFVRQMGDEHIEFAPDRVRIGDAELPVRYVVEKDRVRVIRTDREHEDRVELLGGGAIRVYFPAGYEAVYQRVPGAG
jgi:hypothetical protein